MSSSTTVTASTGTPDSTVPAGWVMRDPAGCPYAWCGSNFAEDAAAALAFLVPDATERQAMVAAGWSMSPRCVGEFIRAGGDLVRASA